MRSSDAIHSILSNGVVHDYPQLDLDGHLCESLLSWGNSYVFALNQLCKRHKLNMTISLNSADSAKQTVCLVVQAGVNQTTGLIDKKTIYYIAQSQGALTYSGQTIEAFSPQPKIALARLILDAVVDAA